MKDFVAEVGFELRSIGLCKVAAICSARMLFDDPRLAPDADRTADVEDFLLASTSECEHLVIFSTSCAYCASVTSHLPLPGLISSTPFRIKRRRTLRSRSLPW